MKTIKLNKKEERVAIANVQVDKEVFKKIDTLSKQYKIAKVQICRHLIESYIDEIKFIK